MHENNKLFDIFAQSSCMQQRRRCLWSSVLFVINGHTFGTANLFHAVGSLGMLNEFSRVKQQSPTPQLSLSLSIFHPRRCMEFHLAAVKDQTSLNIMHVGFLFSFFQLHPFVGLFDASAGMARRAGYGGHRGSRPARGRGATLGLHPPSKYPALQSAVPAAPATVERRCCVAGMWRK